MEFTHMFEGLTLLKVGQAVVEYGAGHVLLVLVALAVTALAVDYSWMLYLHFKMVSYHTPYNVEVQVLRRRSRQDHYLYP